MTAGSSAVAGNYYFALAESSAASSIATLTVSAVGTVTLGAQAGTIAAGTAGTATYTVTTTDISDSTAGVFSWYSDSAGKNAVSVPAGIIASVSSISGNLATITMTASTSTTAGIYYFSLTEGVSVSPLAMLTISTSDIIFANGTAESALTLEQYVSTLAGTGGSGHADGIGIAASFRCPSGITSDGTNLFVTDFLNNEIRKIVISTGAVTTFAGSTTSGHSDGVGSAASFYRPYCHGSR
jgi:hypothetical protein